MIKYIIKRIVKIYTPFVCAALAITHGVLYLLKCDYKILYVISDLTGHSILLLLYILCTCSKMCIWYKSTVYLLMANHLVNVFYYMGVLDYLGLIYYAIVLNTLAVITFLIYRVSVGITKFLC